MDIQRLSKKLLETLTPEELIAIENGEVILDGNRAESYARGPRERTIIDKRIYTPRKKEKDFHFVAAWEVLTQSTFELGEAIATEDDPKMYFYDRKLVLAVDNEFLDLGRIKASEWRAIEEGFVDSSLPESTYTLSEIEDSFTLTFNTVVDQSGWVYLNYYCDIAKFTLSATFDSYEGILDTAYYDYRAWLSDPTDTETLGELLVENDPGINYTSSSVLSLNGEEVASHFMNTLKSDQVQVTRANQVYPYVRYLQTETWRGTVGSVTGSNDWVEWDITVEVNYKYWGPGGFYFKVTDNPFPVLGTATLQATFLYRLNNPGAPWDNYTASIFIEGDGHGALTGNLYPNNPVFTGSGSDWISAGSSNPIWAGYVTVGERFEGQPAQINVTWSDGSVQSFNGKGKSITHEVQIRNNPYRLRDYGGYWSEEGLNPQLISTDETVAYTTTKSDYTANISETELTAQEYTKDSIILNLTNTNKVTAIVQGSNVKLVNYRYIEIDPKQEAPKWEDDESFIVDGDNWVHWFKVYEQSGNKHYVYLVGFKGSKATITERRIYARETTINEANEEEYRYAQYLSLYDDENPYEKDIGSRISSLGWVTGQINPDNFTGLEVSLFSLFYDYGSLNRLGGSWTHIDKKGWIAWFRVREGRYRGDRSTKQYEFLIGFTGKKNKVKRRKIYAIEIDKNNNAKYAELEDTNIVSIDTAIASLNFVTSIQITDFWTNPTSYNLSFSQSPNEIFEANTHKPVSSAQEIVKGRLITPLSSDVFVDIEKIKPKGLWEGFYPTIEEDYVLTYQDKGIWNESGSYEKGDTVKRKNTQETKYRTYIATRKMQPTEQEPTIPDPLISPYWVLIYDDRLTPISPMKYKLVSNTVGYF